MPPALTSGDDRLGPAELLRQAEYFSDAFITPHLLDAIPSVLLILNHQRQIVYANSTLFELVGGADAAMLRGLRPGEALRCVHAGDSPAGCGDSAHCRACGVLGAILASLGGGRQVRDCRISRHRDGLVEALDLRVQATPLDYGGEQFTIFSIADISHEKRRQALERIFFHDILNLAGGIRGFAEVLQEADPAVHGNLTGRIHQTAQRIIEEIESQRTLAAAESQDLRPRPETVSAAVVLQEVCGIYVGHEVARDCRLHIELPAGDLLLKTDPSLLGRVLGNMVKNALEACQPGETVTASCRPSGDGVEFRVHNPGVIPEPARLQIFQRSFSTRGPGRGLGTYSMRLLTQDYLRGKVSFVSEVATGTTFSVLLPCRWPGT